MQLSVATLFKCRIRPICAVNCSAHNRQGISEFASVGFVHPAIRLTRDAFRSNVDAFPDFFRRVLAMTLVTSLSFTTRRLLLAFIIHAFQSLDVVFVKKELAPLAQIHIWAGLSSEGRRNAEFDKHPPLKRIWKGSQKRFDAAGMTPPSHCSL